MKTSRYYFLWILSLALGLMTLILTAQIYTSRNVKGLVGGNQEAAITFTINNSLQEIVNIAFSLESKLLKKSYKKSGNQSFKDSLTILGYNASVLEKLNLDAVIKNDFSKLNSFIGREVSIGFGVTRAFENGNAVLQTKLTDSLLNLKLSDSIYAKAVSIGKSLQAKLQNTLNQNTLASGKLSNLNKAIALIAIAAILILGTIIINRHLKQAELISDLGKANSEVKRSAMIKDQFLANMSHEIRTPLNAIKGFSGLMLQTPLNTEQQQYADIIKSSSLHLMSLVDDILDISRIEAGKMMVEHRDFNLENLMLMLENMFKNAAREAGIEYNWQVNEDVPKILFGDPDRLGQILINLLGNAIKFTPRGSISIGVSRVEKPSKEIWLRFTVSDTGVGISPDKMDIIFERFQQASGNRQALQKGTGLGLAIVKNLAMILGGEVSVESELNKGSVFSVLLPFNKGSEDMLALGTAKAQAIQYLQFPDAKVLVAEDNKVNQLLLTHLLRQNAIVPEIGENGIEIMEILKRQPFDLLLLDIQMPLMDGYETAREIREKNIPLTIVAMTAFVMPGEKEKCLSAGMNDYIAKPIDEKKLQEILARYLPRHDTAAVNPIGQTIDDAYLLKLSGGDKKMAGLILEGVKHELPGEIEKLDELIRENDMGKLSSVCHHLVSTISPLGNDSGAMQKILYIQKKINGKEEKSGLLQLVKELRTELESLNTAIHS